MKTKGITVWEQYLDRMVVAAALLFMLGFGAWQILREPNVVESRGHTLRPADADEQLLKKAAEIAKKLDDQQAPSVDIPDASSLVDQFRQSLVASISPDGRLDPTEPRVAIVGLTPTRGPADASYVEPVVPAPQRIVAKQDFNGLAPEVLAAHASLKEDPRFAEGPYDLTWVTVAATFDLASVRSAFSTAGPNGELAIPASWYGDIMRALDVKLERETNREGTWTDQTVLEPIPGQFSFRSELAGPVDKARSDDVLARLAAPGAQQSIVQPDFLALIGETFVPPDPRAEQASRAPDGDAKPEDVDYQRLKRQRDGLWKLRQRKVDDLKKLGGTLEPAGGEDPAGPAGGGQPGAGGEGTGGGAPPGAGGRGGEKGSGEKKGKAAPGMGGGGSGPGMTAPGDESGKRRGADNAEVIKALQKKIAELDVKIARLDDQLKQLRPDAAIASADGADDGVGVDGFTGDTVDVWAYDITAKPGEIYRYRLIVEIHNPFFARRMNLNDAQKHLADSLTLASQASEWSADMELQPFTEIFVTSAHAPDPEHPDRTRGQLRMGQAQAEVWRFRNARWEDQQFTVEPGDRVGGKREERAREGAEAPSETDFGTDWFVLDIVDDIDVVTRPEREQGHAAIVWLQSLADPQKRVRLSPLEALASERRRDLRDQVEMRADAEDELARRE